MLNDYLKSKSSQDLKKKFPVQARRNELLLDLYEQYCIISEIQDKLIIKHPDMPSQAG